MNEAGERPAERDRDSDVYSTQFDSVNLYMRHVGDVPLLTRAREVEIAIRIEQAELEVLDLVQAADPELGELKLPDDGLDRPRIDLVRLHRERLRGAMDRLRVRDADARERAGSRRVNATTWSRIASAQRRVDRARAEMVEANLRLVVAIAKRHVNRGLPFLDLIQEGNIGLMRAIDKFEYRRGYKFSTYATWWIRQAITRAVTDQSRTIRIPVHVAELLNRMNRVVRELVRELGREPTCEEIGLRMDVASERVRWIQFCTRAVVSLDNPVGDGDESLLGDFVEDSCAPSPPELAVAADLAEKTRRALSVLTVREEKVLRMRFGIGEPGAHTLEEVGQVFKVTRERIRQIESRALRALRGQPATGELKSFLD